MDTSLQGHHGHGPDTKRDIFDAASELTSFSPSIHSTSKPVQPSILRLTKFKLLLLISLWRHLMQGQSVRTPEIPSQKFPPGPRETLQCLPGCTFKVHLINSNNASTYTSDALDPLPTICPSLFYISRAASERMMRMMRVMVITS